MMNTHGTILFKNLSRYSRHMATCAKSLKYSEVGKPMEVLNICKDTLENPKDTQVLVKMLAAPVHPVDVFTIEGSYPLKPKLPAVGGHEGVGEVVCAGEKAKKFKQGDHVVMLNDGLGTWRTNALFCENHLMVVPKTVLIPEAATLVINPATAYRMLKDFVPLKAGDTVIQNAANSAVGRAVHQLCKAWKINSVGVVRNREDVDKLKEDLKCSGATCVFTEEEFCETTIFKDKNLKRPLLAINGVGGESAHQLARHLDSNGVVVTYGAMSRKPTPASTAYMIFKNVAFRGFWITRWNRANMHKDNQKNMYKEIMKLMEEGYFKAPPHKWVALDSWQEAKKGLTLEEYTNKKYIFKLDCDQD